MLQERAVHPRHGLFYKSGFAFAVILLLSLIVFIVIVMTGTHVMPPTAREIRLLVVASLFLTVVSFFIDSLQFKRWTWAAIDGMLSLVTLIVVIRNISH